VEFHHHVGEQPVDELTSDAQELGRLPGGDFFIVTQDHDPLALRHVVEHRPQRHGDLGIAGHVDRQPVGETARFGADPGAGRVERGDSESNHDPTAAAIGDHGNLDVSWASATVAPSCAGSL